MQSHAFYAILEAAAARAWSRRTRAASTLAPLARSSPALASPETRSHSAPTSASDKPQVPAKALSVDDWDRRDPGRVSDARWSDPPIDADIPVGIPTQMPLPTSPRSLYRNLLLFSSHPPFSLSTAVDYYFDWPKALHSTKSFNLLISLALRSASFASVRRLFAAMRAESIPANMETCKLRLRWLVRVGKWNDAWRHVLETTGQRNASTMLPTKPIPLPLWLELFGSQKRGALRRWVVADCGSNAVAVSGAKGGISPDPGLGQESRLSAGMKHAAIASPPPQKRLVPRSCHRSRAVELSRYRALLRVSPLLASADQVQILPRAILIITQTMHRVGQGALAFSTTLAYLKSLPPRLRRCDRRRVLDLVNFHLSMVGRRRKAGLKQHFAQRRLLWKCLHARPDLKPSSATLFLLLGPLRGCRRSGTLAMQCLGLFENRWGSCVTSGLVRRRVANLALKEGRLDIVATMLRQERRSNVPDSVPPRTVHTSRRRPWRTFCSRRGAEDRRWQLIEDKYQRRIMSRSQS